MNIWKDGWKHRSRYNLQKVEREGLRTEVGTDVNDLISGCWIRP